MIHCHITKRWSGIDVFLGEEKNKHKEVKRQRVKNVTRRPVRLLAYGTNELWACVVAHAIAQ